MSPTTTTNKQSATKRDSPAVSERREIDLDRPEDLELFLIAVNDLYADTTAVQAVAVADGYRRVGFADVAGHEVFLTAKLLYAELTEQITACKQAQSAERAEIPERVIDMMQSRYDDLVLLRDHIVRAYDAAPEVTDHPPSGTVTEKPGSVAVAAAQQPSTGTSAAEGPDRADEAQGAHLYSVIERMLQSAARSVEQVRARVLNRLPPTARTPELEAELTKLQDCVRQVEDLQERLAIGRQAGESLSVPILTATLEKYSETVVTVTRCATEIEARIVQQLPSGSVAKSASPESTHRVRTSMIPPESEFGESNEERGERKTKKSRNRRGKAKVGSGVTAQAPVARGQVGTSVSRADRQQAGQLSEVVQAAVAAGQPPPVFRERVTERQPFAHRGQPLMEQYDLSTKATRLLRRLVAGSSDDPSILERARALEHTFRIKQSDPRSTEHEVQAAYTAFEQFVMHERAAWLMVCGQPVPAAGPAGVSAARALRETLLVERDRNRDLVKDPHKQLLVDKLIRKLSVIPSDGLSADTDIPAIIELMDAIDVPGQQAKLATSSVASELPTSAKIGLGVDRPQHRQMQIVPDESEVPIAITVAEKTKARLDQEKTKSSRRAQSATSAEAQLLPESPAKAEQEIVSQLEAQDPVSTVKPVYHNAVMRPDPQLAADSLTARYLTEPAYRTFISETYSSPAAFERLLDSTITRLEARALDPIERWLHEEYASPFVFLQHLSIQEVLELGALPELRAILREANIKYEAFLIWFDLIDEMQALVGEDLELPFGALYAKWMVASEMLRAADRQHINA